MKKKIISFIVFTLVFVLAFGLTAFAQETDTSLDGGPSYEDDLGNANNSEKDLSNASDKEKFEDGQKVLAADEQNLPQKTEGTVEDSSLDDFSSQDLKEETEAENNDKPSDEGALKNPDENADGADAVESSSAQFETVQNNVQEKAKSDYFLTISSADGKSTNIPGGAQTDIADVLRALGNDIDENSVITFDPESVDTDVIGLAVNENGKVVLTDNGPFEKAGKTLVVYVNGVPVRLEIVDDEFISYYVSKSGNNSDAGTEDKPFLTIGNAIGKYSGTLIRITLLSDITENITIASNQEIILDLNGYVLKGTGNGSVIHTSGTFTLDDTSQAGTGKVTGGNGTYISSLYEYDGGGVYVSSGTFTMKGGNISGNECREYEINGDTSNGGGVYVSTGTFTMDGGAITENVANDGAGVYIAENASFTMNGGSISKNRIKQGDKDHWARGGGVFIGYGSQWGYSITADSPNASFTMNGGTISENIAKNGGGVFINYYADFTMKNGTITKNEAKYQGGYSSGGGIFNYGTFIMESGTISENTAQGGGGVYNNYQYTFIMKDGLISKNTATSGGGGVANSGTFTMTGGTISENLAQKDIGGGVYNYGTFTMTAGTISDNTTNKNGGGVGCPGLLIIGGTANITGNKYVTGDNTSDDNIYMYYKSTESYYKPITVNPDFTGSAGVNVNGGKDYFTAASSEDFSKRFTSDNASYKVYNTGTGSNQKLYIGIFVAEISETKQMYETVQSAVNATTADNKTVVMIDNSKENIVIESGKNVILDLNGFVLTGTGDDGGDSAVTVKGNLTVKDSNTTAENTVKGIKIKGGVIADGYGKKIGGDKDAGGGVYVDNGTFTLTSGTINCGMANYGGGVYVKSGTFTMTAGTVSGNNADLGGGVYVESGTFNMEAGSISGNNAGQGGGVYVKSGTFTMTAGTVSGNNAVQGGGVYVDTATAAFTMTDGSISENKAEKDTKTGHDGDGGGVYIYEGTFTMEGGSISHNAADYGAGVFNMEKFVMTNGTISDNSASENGGGVYCFDSMTAGGTAKITGNTGVNKLPDNVFLSSFSLICISEDNAPQNGMSIGVRTYSVPASGETLAVTGKNSVNYKSCFSSDNSDYMILDKAEGDKHTVVLGVHDHNWSYEVIANDTIKATCASSECEAKDLLLTIDVSDFTYDGKGHGAAFKQATFLGKVPSDVVTIEYYIKDTATGLFTQKLDSAPIKAGMYKLSVTAGTGSTAACVSREYRILQKQLEVTGTTVQSKEYDGTAFATVKIGTVTGIVEGDTVIVGINVNESCFSDADAGQGKTVTVEYSVHQKDAENYLAPKTDSSLKADITPIKLNVSGTAVSGKTYDGTADASATIGTVSGILAGDDAQVGINKAYFNNADVGTGKEVTVEYSISGKKASNYSVSNFTTSADISQKDGKNNTIGKIDAVIYSGNEQKPSITVYDGTNVVNADDYDVAYNNNINVGTASVTVTFKNNYYGSIENTFTIEEATASLNDGSTTTYYRTVQEAFDAAKLGYGKIVMRLDSVENIVVPYGDYNLDLHGHTLSASSGTVINNDKGQMVLTDSVGGGKVTGGDIGVEQNKSLLLSGNVSVVGNKKNIYLPSGNKVSADGSFNGIVGITTQDKPTVGNPVSFTEPLLEPSKNVNCFKSDDEDFVVFLDGNVFKLGAAVAEIEGGEKFMLVSDAVKKAADGDVIRLLEDINGDIAVDTGKNITIDLNGINVTGNIEAADDSILTIVNNAEKTGSVKGALSTANGGKLSVKAGLYSIEPDKEFIANGFQLIKNDDKDTMADFPFMVVEIITPDANASDSVNKLIVDTDDDNCSAFVEISGTAAVITVKDKDGNLVSPKNVKILQPEQLLQKGAITAQIRMSDKLTLILDIKAAMCGRSSCVIKIDNIKGIITVSCDNDVIFTFNITDIIDSVRTVVYDGETVKAYDADGNLLKEI